MSDSNAENPEEQEQTDLERLQELRKLWASDEAFAAHLRKLDKSFDSIDRSTISRWLKPKGGLPPRARHAIELLSSRETEKTVRIVISKSPANLPFVLACTPDSETGRTPFDPVGIKPDLVFRQTGGEALDELEEGRADLAIAGKELSKRSFVDRLFTIAEHQLIGVSGGKQLAHPSDFSRAHFRFPPRTSLEDFLPALLRRKFWINEDEGTPKIREFRESDPSDRIEWLKSGSRDKPHCIIAWRAWFEDHRLSLKETDLRANKLFQVASSFMPWEIFDLYKTRTETVLSASTQTIGVCVDVLMEIVRTPSWQGRLSRADFSKKPESISEEDWEKLTRFERVKQEGDSLKFVTTDGEVHVLRSLWR